jgi:hypothetical protein
VVTDPGPRGGGEHLVYEPVLIQSQNKAAAQVNAWKAAVEKIHKRMVTLNPELVIISLGLDGLALDSSVHPSGVGKLRTADYVWAVELFKSLGCRLLIITEGGYGLNGLSTGPFARTHLQLVSSSRYACLCASWGLTAWLTVYQTSCVWHVQLKMLTT